LTGHLQLIDQDYKRLRPFNIGTVREGIRWSQVEMKPYHYDWTTVKYMIERGKANGIQQLWDLCHFGFPDDLTPCTQCSQGVLQHYAQLLLIFTALSILTEPYSYPNK
jgi:hypothetical protein